MAFELFGELFWGIFLVESLLFGINLEFFCDKLIGDSLLFELIGEFFWRLFWDDFLSFEINLCNPCEKALCASL